MCWRSAGGLPNRCAKLQNRAGASSNGAMDDKEPEGAHAARGRSEDVDEIDAHSCEFEEVMRLSPTLASALNSMKITDVARVQWLRGTPEWFRQTVDEYFASRGVDVVCRLITLLGLVR